MTVAVITRIVLFVAVVGLLAYDVWAFLAGGTKGTISWNVYELSYKYPSMTFGVGFVCGHLFWQMRVKE